MQSVAQIVMGLEDGGVAVVPSQTAAKTTCPLGSLRRRDLHRSFHLTRATATTAILTKSAVRGTLDRFPGASKKPIKLVAYKIPASHRRLACMLPDRSQRGSQGEPGAGFRLLVQQIYPLIQESIMQAWKLLFSSDVGLFSVAVFIVMFAMIGYFLWLFNFKKDATEARK